MIIEIDPVPIQRTTDSAAEANETAWLRARTAVELARSAFLEHLQPIERVDIRVAALRAERRAADRNVLSTERAARYSGLMGTPAMVRKLGQLRAEVQGLREQTIREIDDAAGLCETANLAWNCLREARVAERAALQTLIATERQRHGTSPRTRELESENDRIDHERRVELKAWIDRRSPRGPDPQLRSRSRDSEPSAPREPLPDEPHYDPKYSDDELRQRRMRPWV